ncbi:MAG: signal peptidase I [Bacilli bacterium]
MKIYFDTIKKVLHYITTVIMYSVFLLLIFVGFILITYVIEVKKSGDSGEFVQPLFAAYVIISPSMTPNIAVQDAVVVKRVDDVSKLKVGDIITFTTIDPRYSGVTVTHRIVNKFISNDKKISFKTKGDYNNAPDDTLVTESYIHGKVILKLPKIGYIQYFLSQSYGWIIAVVLPCLGIIIYDILRVFKLVGKSISIKKSKEKEIKKDE